jgi:hypothetical protein
MNRWCYPTLFLMVFVGCMANSYDAVSLRWKPTSDIGSVSHGGISNLVFTIQPFRDVRTDKKLIGRNIESAGKMRPVTTQEDVGKWTSDRVADLLKMQGLHVGSQGQVIVSGDVLKFEVEESDTYRGQVMVKLYARDAKGAMLWEGIMSGSADRFGRSFNLENYYEVLSDSLIEGVSSLLSRTDFVQSVKIAKQP